MPINDDIYELGKNIHALAAYYLKKENIHKMELTLDMHEKEIWKYLKETNYFSYETINTEYNLSIKINKHYYGGRLDALVKNNDIYYILDYKTGSAPKNAKYDFQTMIYMLAVQDFFKTDNVIFVYLDLKNREEVKIELTRDLEQEYRTKLVEITNKIELEAFEKKYKDCKCEYNIICY